MAVDLFLDFSAGPSKGGTAPITIVGESQDTKYAKTVELKSFELAAENKMTIGSAATGAGAGKLLFDNLKIVKSLDSASAPMFVALATGAHFPTVKLYVRKAGSAGGAAYVTYTFSMVFVSKLDVVLASGDDAPAEDLELVFGAMQVSYIPSGPTGQAGTPIVGTWSQVTNSSTLTVPGN